MGEDNALAISGSYRLLLQSMRETTKVVGGKIG